MKTLYMVRHAKSTWNFQQLDDFSRPLGKRGRKNVRAMGKRLAREVMKPDLIVTSSASRAFYTSLFLADAWGYKEDRIQLEPALYHANDDEIIEIIKEYGHEHSRLAIFGHNPGFTNAANSLQSLWIDNLPTCSVLGISFDIKDWDEIESVKGKREFYIAPGEVKNTPD